MYLKFNLFKCPALRLTHERWSGEKTDQDNIFFFPFLSKEQKEKKKAFFTDVGRKPGIVWKKSHLSILLGYVDLRTKKARQSQEDDKELDNEQTQIGANDCI